MKLFGVTITSSKAKSHCKFFEGNTGALEIARIVKFHPRTKHFNFMLHNFISYANNTKEDIHTQK